MTSPRNVEDEAWITLATNDTYGLGALTLGRSLQRVGTTRKLVVLITPGVTALMRERLSEVFDLVQEVNVLDSGDAANLQLLARPDLGVTLTKLHCWRLTQFKKAVFLDADVLVLQNSDELFSREEFSAAPDVGWPDCFNSGVFVFQPSQQTYDALVQTALTVGSFDGGDQGLLNVFFSNWATSDISKHLPFIYNMTSSSSYTYVPAYQQFGKNVKIVHFIGPIKPWMHTFNSSTGQVESVPGAYHAQEHLQNWWNIFLADVQHRLHPDLAGLAGQLSLLTLGQDLSLDQKVLNDRARQFAWEQGQADYLGADSFSNIQKKLDEALSVAPITTAPTSENEAAPETPAEAPVTSPAAPVAVAEAPVATAEAPVATAEAPVATPEAPVATAEAPVATPEAPVATAEAPVATAEAPVATAEAPVVTAEAPVATAEAPVATAETPVATAEAPVATAEAPVATAEAPVATAEAPVATAEAPVATPEAPVTTPEVPTETSTATPEVPTSSAPAPVEAVAESLVSAALSPVLGSAVSQPQDDSTIPLPVSPDPHFTTELEFVPAVTGELVPESVPEVSSAPTGEITSQPLESTIVPTESSPAAVEVPAVAEAKSEVSTSVSEPVPAPKSEQPVASESTQAQGAKPEVKPPAVEAKPVPPSSESSKKSAGAPKGKVSSPTSSQPATPTSPTTASAPQAPPKGKPKGTKKPKSP